MTKIRKIILVTMVLMLLSSVGYGADWKHFSTHEDGSTLSYDTQTVSRGQDTLKVWLKEIFSDKAKMEYIKKFSTQSGIENISYSQGMYEINCKKRLHRLLSFALYSSEGKVIDSKDCPDCPFLEIFPDTQMAQLVDILCK
jgi:hypothetical protein